MLTTCFFCDAYPSLSFATLRVGNTCSTGPSPTITIWPWCTNPPYFHPGRVRNGGGGCSGCGGFRVGCADIGVVVAVLVLVVLVW